MLCNGISLTLCCGAGWWGKAWVRLYEYSLLSTYQTLMSPIDRLRTMSDRCSVYGEWVYGESQNTNAAAGIRRGSLHDLSLHNWCKKEASITSIAGLPPPFLICRAQLGRSSCPMTIAAFSEGFMPVRLLVVHRWLLSVFPDTYDISYYRKN